MTLLSCWYSESRSNEMDSSVIWESWLTSMLVWIRSLLAWAGNGLDYLGLYCCLIPFGFSLSESLGDLLLWLFYYADFVFRRSLLEGRFYCVMPSFFTRPLDELIAIDLFDLRPRPLPVLENCIEGVFRSLSLFEVLLFWKLTLVGEFSSILKLLNFLFIMVCPRVKFWRCFFLNSLSISSGTRSF